MFNPFLGSKAALYHAYETAQEADKAALVQLLLHNVSDKDAADIYQKLSIGMAAKALVEGIFSLFSPKRTPA